MFNDFSLLLGNSNFENSVLENGNAKNGKLSLLSNQNGTEGENKGVFADVLKSILKNIKNNNDNNTDSKVNINNIDNVSSLSQYNVDMNSLLSKSDLVSLLNGNSKEVLNKIFKTILKTSNTENSEDIFIDQSALKDFKLLLNKMGFNSSDVEEVISKIKNDLSEKGTNKIALSELLVEIEEIEIDDEALKELILQKEIGIDLEEDTFINVAELPFLQSILSDMGITEEDFDKIRSASVVKGKGISLEAFVKETKETIKNLNLENTQNSNSIKTETVDVKNNDTLKFNTDTNLNNFSLLLSKINKTSDSSLNNFSLLLSKLNKTSDSSDSEVSLDKNILNINKDISQEPQMLQERGLNESYEGELKQTLNNFLSHIKVKSNNKQNVQYTEENSTSNKTNRIVNNSNNDKLSEIITSDKTSENSNSILFDSSKSNKIQNIKINQNSETLNKSVENTLTQNNDILNLKQKEILDTDFTEQEDFIKTFQDIIKNEESVFKNSKISKNSDDIKIKKVKAESTLDIAEDVAEGVGKTDAKSSARKASSNQTTSKSSQEILPSYITRQMNRQMLRALNNNLKEISFQLKPVNLGKIKLTIDTTKDGLKVSVLTEQKNAKELIVNSSSDLKNSLIEQGVAVKSIDIDMAFNFDQSMAKQMEQNLSKNKNSKGFSIDNIEEANADLSVEEAIISSKNDNGDISFFI